MAGEMSQSEVTRDVNFPGELPKSNKEWEVIVTETYTCTGMIKVQAFDEEEAESIVQGWMNNPKNPLERKDSRIEWGDLEYEEGSFEIDDVQ